MSNQPGKQINRLGIIKNIKYKINVTQGVAYRKIWQAWSKLQIKGTNTWYIHQATLIHMSGWCIEGTTHSAAATNHNEKILKIATTVFLRHTHEQKKLSYKNITQRKNEGAYILHNLKHCTFDTRFLGGLTAPSVGSSVGGTIENENENKNGQQRKRISEHYVSNFPWLAELRQRSGWSVGF